MKTCLVVDDSKVIRAVARRILESFAFEVREATDGREALQSCIEAMPDAVLLDWHMPGLNGIEFVHALRASDGGDAPVVLFCTTENDAAHIVQALNAGANEYIMKPFDGEILAAKLAQVGLL